MPPFSSPQQQPSAQSTIKNVSYSILQLQQSRGKNCFAKLEISSSHIELLGYALEVL